MDVSRAWTLLEVRRYQVGSDGCISAETLLETQRYQVGSAGCISIADVFPNRTLPGWQRWMHLDRGCFQKLDVTRLSAMDASRFVDASRNRTLPGWLGAVSGHQTNPVPNNYQAHFEASDTEAVLGIQDHSIGIHGGPYNNCSS